MALVKTNYETGHGVILPEAYIIITSFCGDPYNLKFDTKVYASYDAYITDKSFLEEFRDTIPFVDGMGLTAAYDHLLTLSNFIGATVHVEPVGSPVGSPQG